MSLVEITAKKKKNVLFPACRLVTVFHVALCLRALKDQLRVNRPVRNTMPAAEHSYVA